MGFAFSSKLAAVTVGTTPAGWPEGWPIPTADPPVWPPGWPGEYIDPTDPTSGYPRYYTLTVTVPASFGYEDAITVEAEAKDPLGGAASELNNHVVVVSGSISGTTVQVKESGGTFADNIYYQVSNYSGSKYGISQSLIWDLNSSDVDSVLTVTASITSTSPRITGTDASTIEDVGMSFARVATTGNITLSGEQTLDGVLTSTDKVLVWQQTTASENGIYTSAAGAWALDKALTAAANMLYKGITVGAGNVFGRSLFVVSAANTASWNPPDLRCRLATTANHGLSGVTAIDGTTPVAEDLILAWRQTTASENGIYIAKSSTWLKVLSFSLADQTLHRSIHVAAGQGLKKSRFSVTAANTVRLAPKTFHCRAATIANHGLSGTTSIDGVTLSVGDLILVWLQTTASENGIYTAQASTWNKIISFDTTDDWVDRPVEVSDGNFLGHRRFVSGADSAELADQVIHCRLATTANITTATHGTTSTDGQTPAAGDLALVWKQSTASQNGIYLVGATAWTKAMSFDSASIHRVVTVTVGTLYGKLAFKITASNTAAAMGAAYL